MCVLLFDKLTDALWKIHKAHFERLISATGGQEDLMDQVRQEGAEPVSEQLSAHYTSGTPFTDFDTNICISHVPGILAIWNGMLVANQSVVSFREEEMGDRPALREELCGRVSQLRLRFVERSRRTVLSSLGRTEPNCGGHGEPARCSGGAPGCVGAA